MNWVVKLGRYPAAGAGRPTLVPKVLGREFTQYTDAVLITMLSHATSAPLRDVQILTQCAQHWASSVSDLGQGWGGGMAYLDLRKALIVLLVV